jgi:glycosyltransferase involved in cell wall biosynthesis
MHIAIIGTRGIPNNYGGFEQFAEMFASRLVQAGHQVTVYCPVRHPYKEKSWQGVNLVHRKDYTSLLGTFGQFFYDLSCILHTRKQDFDIILQLGYTSSAVWSRFMPRNKSVIVTNMDGLEWKRSKYTTLVRSYLRYAERLATLHSDQLVADANGIKAYIEYTYDKSATFIPYGAEIIDKPDQDALTKYGLDEYRYNLAIARLEPENNLEMMLTGSLLQQNKSPMPFLVIGNHQTKYGIYLKRKYSSYPHIRFLAATYNKKELNSLRYYSHVYFHGHSVGGTNPSLLEAMGGSALVCAHDNIFNREVLGSDGYYFSTPAEVGALLDTVRKCDETVKLTNNKLKVSQRYNWDLITNQYLHCFQEALSRRECYVDTSLKVPHGY